MGFYGQFGRAFGRSTFRSGSRILGMAATTTAATSSFNPLLGGALFGLGSLAVDVAGDLLFDEANSSSEQIDKNKEKIKKNTERIKFINEKLKTMKTDIKENKTDVREIKKDIKLIHRELKSKG